MSKYYLVPVTSRNIKIGNKTLFDILKVVDSRLYSRELTRIRLTYDHPESKILNDSGYIKEYNEVSSMIYKDRVLPEKIILKSDKSGLHELYSGLEVVCDNETFLSVFQVDAFTVKNIISNDFSYQEKIDNFFRKNKKKKKFLFKRKNSVKQGK